jgi:hypothetical protein
MSFRSVLEKNWRRLVKSLRHDERQKLLEILCQEYIEETQNLLQFLRHAARMRYPQFRDRLVSIARQEQGHVQWLQGKIIALGGEVPRISFAPQVGMNYPAASCGVSKIIDENLSQRRHPRMFSSGVQSRFRLDSR